MIFIFGDGMMEEVKIQVKKFESTKNYKQTTKTGVRFPVTPLPAIRQ
jgi:hypothetical protein